VSGSCGRFGEGPHLCRRDSKAEDGVRSIAVPSRPQAELAGHYQRTAFKGSDERVFCHPERGTIYRAETFNAALVAAQEAAQVATASM
jgi:hypothetical protein